MILNIDVGHAEEIMGQVVNMLRRLLSRHSFF
jgi:hypothetical protein